METDSTNKSNFSTTSQLRSELSQDVPTERALVSVGLEDSYAQQEEECWPVEHRVDDP